MSWAFAGIYLPYRTGDRCLDLYGSSLSDAPPNQGCITHPEVDIQMVNSTVLDRMTREQTGRVWSSDLGRVDAQKEDKDGRKQRDCCFVILIDWLQLLVDSQYFEANRLATCVRWDHKKMSPLINRVCCFLIGLDNC